MKRLGLSLLLLCALVPWVMSSHSVATGEDAAAWATQWLDASAHSDYQGTLVVNQGGNLSTFALWHRADDESGNPREERLRRQDGPLFEIVRTDDRITCLHAPGADIPEDHELPGSPFAQLMHLDPELMAQNYQVIPQGEERVAGRSARVFELAPRHAENRLRHRIWLDEATQVVLRHGIVSADDVVLEDARFVVFEPELSDMPRTIASRFRDLFWHRYQQNPAEQTNSADAVWRLEPPAGFQQQVAEERGNGWYQLWSDGVVEFSLMVEPAPDDVEGAMADQRGSSVLVSALHGDWLVVVVGDLPEAVAYEVLDRVNWQL